MKRQTAKRSTWHELHALAKSAKHRPTHTTSGALRDALLKVFPKTYAKFTRAADAQAHKTRSQHCVVFEPYYLSRRYLNPDQLAGDELKRRSYRWQVDILFAIGSCDEIDPTKYAVIYVATAPATRTRVIKKKTSRRPPAERALQKRESAKWHSRELPDRSGMYDYVVLIRAPGDPERKPRPKKGQPRQEAAPHLRIKKTNAESWAKQIATHMNDGRERTFNRIAVEMLDKTADVVGGTTFEDALWLLVKQGVLEYTWEAPILFRKRKRATSRTA